MGFTSLLSVLEHFWVIYYRHTVAIFFPTKFLKMDVNWGRTKTNLFSLGSSPNFSGTFLSLIFSTPAPITKLLTKFFKKSNNVFLEQAKKSYDCCFFEENGSFQLDCTVIIPFVNGTCKIKQAKNCLSWITLSWGRFLNKSRNSNADILDPFQQIVFQVYPHSALLSSILLRAVKPEIIG